MFDRFSGRITMVRFSRQKCFSEWQPCAMTSEREQE
jgi:hypothetical protein